MGKRSCPFDESFTPQLKIHVSELEKNSKCLEIIHSKTLALLFSGSKKKDFSKKDNSNISQTCINCVSGSNLIYKCWFCENSLCSNCSENCEACGEIFCRNCSVKKYDSQGGITCLSCFDEK